MTKIRKIKPETIKAMEAKAPSGKMWPSFSIELKHLPEAKKWKPKGKFRLVLDVDMTGLHIDKGVEEDYGCASFDVTGIGILPRAKAKKRVKRYE